METELVYGDGPLRWAYETSLGMMLGDRLLSRRWFSSLYGAYQDTRLSARKIQPFVRSFGVRLEDFEAAEYRSFNEFFIRRFRPGARPFVDDPRRLAAFAEARYLAFDRVGSETRLPVKGEHLSARALLGDATLAEPFEGGPVLIARLCPVDYHRFHFPCDGRWEGHFTVPGAYHSVNPVALAARSDIFATNERQVSLFETLELGRLAYVEVGAMCVGRIVQSARVGSDFRRGDEKGHFLFGASTVILLGEPGAWAPDEDLLRHSREGREVWVKLGDGLATSTKGA